MFLENPGKWIDEDSHEVLVSALSAQAKEKLLDGVSLVNEILADEMGGPGMNDVNPIDRLNMLHEQTGSMLVMMMVYLDQLRDGGEAISETVLEGYVGQMKANMELAGQATIEIENLLKGSKG